MAKAMKGAPAHVARLLADKIGYDTTEFFLPRDFGFFCTGCKACFLQSETACPHHSELEPILRAMDAADVLILASPVYVLRATGSMKAFLDHMAFRAMVHRPEASMFSKQAVCISTAGGAGMDGANAEMAASLSMWGVSTKLDSRSRRPAGKRFHPCQKRD